MDSVPLQNLMSIDKQYVDHNYGEKKPNEKPADIDLFAEIEKQKQEIAGLTGKK